MRWVMILLLLCVVELAWAQETEEPLDFPPDKFEAYDQAIRRFNTHTKSFTSWNAFKMAVIAQLPPGVIGNCYAQTSGSMQGGTVTRVKFQPVEGDDWQKSSGNGWRKSGPKRTFVEYRFNQKTGVLLRLEGFKPRFFFAKTERICEFPLRK